MSQIQETREVQHVSLSVVEAVADAEGVPPEDLTPPLYDAIDPDALDALFRNGRGDGTVEFPYLGYRISVESDGKTTVEKEER